MLCLNRLQIQHFANEILDFDTLRMLKYLRRELCLAVFIFQLGHKQIISVQRHIYLILTYCFICQKAKEMGPANNNLIFKSDCEGVQLRDAEICVN